MKLPLGLAALCFLGAIFIGCGKAKKADEPTASSGDAIAGSGIPEGFAVVAPNYLGFKVNPDATVSESEFAAKECDGQEVGAFFSVKHDYNDEQGLRFCLGSFASPDSPNSIEKCIDCATKVAVTNLYIGVTTDKTANGVADASFIAITETATMIRTQCYNTDFGDYTNLTSGYGDYSVSKAVPEQVVSLQRGRGVCSSVKLDDATNLQDVTMANYAGRKATFALTAVTLTGR